MLYYHRTLGTADLGTDLFITKSVYMYMCALSINGFRLKITKGLVLYCISTVCVFNIFHDTETLLQNTIFIMYNSVLGIAIPSVHNTDTGIQCAKSKQLYLKISITVPKYFGLELHSIRFCK